MQLHRDDLSVQVTMSWVLPSMSCKRLSATASVQLVTMDLACRGRNTSGQVGSFETIVHENPVSLKELEGANVSSISAAKHHSAAVVDGIAWTWGQGSLGELGRGLSHEYCRPQRYCTIALPFSFICQKAFCFQPKYKCFLTK